MPLGYCEQYSTSVFPAIFFLVMDFGLSVFLLVMFIMPLKYHAVMIAKNVDKSSLKPLQRLARRNLILSSVMIVSMTGSLIFMIYVLNELVNSGFQFTNLNSAKVLGSHIDCFVTFFCCHLLSSIWLPPALRQYFKAESKASTTLVSAQDKSQVSPSVHDKN